jgi:hypothetical protein
VPPHRWSTTSATHNSDKSSKSTPPAKALLSEFEGVGLRMCHSLDRSDSGNLQNNSLRAEYSTAAFKRSVCDVTSGGYIDSTSQSKDTRYPGLRVPFVFIVKKTALDNCFRVINVHLTPGGIVCELLHEEA